MIIIINTASLLLLLLAQVTGPEWAYEPARALGVKTVPAASTHPERDTPMDNGQPLSLLPGIS